MARLQQAKQQIEEEIDEASLNAPANVSPLRIQPAVRLTQHMRARARCWARRLNSCFLPRVPH